MMSGIFGRRPRKESTRNDELHARRTDLGDAA
jgi:hypothetical protein